MKKTDSSYFDEKVNLRLNHLPNKNEIKVLDCYAGYGHIWKKIREVTSNVDIEVLSIEKDRKKAEAGCIIANNIDILTNINLDYYDIVDLDAYGVPYQQLKILFNRKYKGNVFITFIQIGVGCLPNKFLFELGFTKSMALKARAIISRNGWQLMTEWLRANGVSRIVYKQINRKVYAYLDFASNV